jgi:hypothetical protein
MGISFEPRGLNIEVRVDATDGVTLMATREGFASLVELFAALRDSENEWDHIHLTPSMQLLAESVALTVGLRP